MPAIRSLVDHNDRTYIALRRMKIGTPVSVEHPDGYRQVNFGEPLPEAVEWPDGARYHLLKMEHIGVGPAPVAPEALQQQVADLAAQVQALQASIGTLAAERDAAVDERDTAKGLLADLERELQAAKPQKGK